MLPGFHSRSGPKPVVLIAPPPPRSRHSHTHLHLLNPAESYGYFTVCSTPPGIPFTQSQPKVHPDPAKACEGLPRVGRGSTKGSHSKLGQRSRALCTLFHVFAEKFYRQLQRNQQLPRSFACPRQAGKNHPGGVPIPNACALLFALLQSRFQQAQRNQQLTPFFAKTTGVGV